MFALMIFLLPMACGDQKDEVETEATDSEMSADSTAQDKIQAMFREAATRWHHGDKAVLYDLEFEYLQEKHTFDEYLTFGQVSYLEADTLVDMVVKGVELFESGDSAHAVVDAIFVGPSGDTSFFADKYRVYYHRGRWIHPTVSVIGKQLEYEDLRRVADSAAAAEAELEGL